MSVISRLFLLFFLLVPFKLMAQVEICDNGIDDDNDGLIDLNDEEDCPCLIIDPIFLIPNPSFEDMDCCPNDRSQLDCASVWIQASEPTTDFIHTCDWLGWDDFPPPMPFPDGEGIMGFRDGRVRGNNDAQPYWKEYAGACLLSPMLKDSIYQIQFDLGFVNLTKSPPIDISFFGTTDCNNLPFGLGNETFGCPSNSPNWERLAVKKVSGGEGNKWVKTTLEITPEEDIYAIAIGPNCAPISTPVSIYYFFDNLLLSDLESFNLFIAQNEHPCSNEFNLSVPYIQDYEYQWYKEGVALSGETAFELSQDYGEGFYQVRVLDGESCRVSAKFEYKIPIFEDTEFVTICQDEIYMFGDLSLNESGIYQDTFKTNDNCDKIVTLELEVIGAQYDTIVATILEGESYDLENYSFKEAGDYPLVLISESGCERLVLLRLSVFNVYIPNIFSPNNDGVNDTFSLYAKEGIIDNINMTIYDRWGNMIHQGGEWDGSEVQLGVFGYLVEITFKNKSTKRFVGSVTVVK